MYLYLLRKVPATVYWFNRISPPHPVCKIICRLHTKIPPLLRAGEIHTNANSEHIIIYATLTSNTMRLLSSFAALALVTQALALPSNFEVKPYDEVALKQNRPEAVKYHHQTQERGDVYYHRTQNGIDGWHRRFVGGDEITSSILEKRKGGGGGFSSRGKGSGGFFSGGSKNSGSKNSGYSSGSRSSSSSSRSSGLASSTGVSFRGFGGGALLGLGLGFFAGSSFGSSYIECPAGCRCNSMDDFRLYFNTPPTHSANSSAVISIATQWHAGYQNKLRTRFEKEIGLISIPDPRYQCDWYQVMDVAKAAVHRGMVQIRARNGNITHAQVDFQLRGRILDILNTTYPTMEIGLILGFTLFPGALLVGYVLVCLCCFCLRGIMKCCARKEKEKEKERADIGQTHASFEVQSTFQPTLVQYGQPLTQPAAQYSFPYDFPQGMACPARI